ncbi:MAG: hypothetical protein AAGC60_21905 [Acidobacteriota bacterium]
MTVALILPSRRRLRWLLVAAVAVGGAVAHYLHEAARAERMHGGSAFGLTYGVLAVGLILLLTAFGWRKRAYRSTLGTLDGWLQVHVYFGLATVPIVLFHAGFRFHDRLATAAFVVMTAVVLSGLAGAVLYTVLPRRLTALRVDLTPDEVEERLNQLLASMAQIAAGRSDSFQRLHERVQRQARTGPAASWRLLVFGAGRRPGDSDDESWRPLLALVDEDERDDLRRLLVLARQHRELHQRLRFQLRYQGLLEAWLVLHVPLTVLLLVLVAIHTVAGLYFSGLDFRWLVGSS